MDTAKFYARQAIDSLGGFVLDALQALIYAERRDERGLCIEAAACAMMDAGVDEDTIREQLQKQWDLRRSEALAVIRRAHGELALRSQEAVQTAA